jgi:hypothetical protein
MLHFNNDHIFTGYLKQLLASFNLPKYKIYTKEQQEYFDKYNKNPNFKELNVIPTIKVSGDKYPEDLRYVPYIKDSKIQHYIKELSADGLTTKYYWQISKNHYHENKKELNHTKTFQIKNNIYDYYTHEYLGDFLRFFRDYYNINLMPLYNCFGNRLCSSLNLSFTLPLVNRAISFSSHDDKFKIYMLPVKLFQKYTIAIDSNMPIELCCGVYDAYLDTKPASVEIAKLTYQKINNASFNHPFIFDKLTGDKLRADDIDLLNLAQNEDDLKLFIKVPINNKSSITVLEGEYLNYNDKEYNTKLDIIEQHKLVTNFFEGQYADVKSETSTQFDTTYVYEPLENRKFKPISQLQLLMMNTGISYPFADRLIEYLSENAITSLDRLPDNIKRAQTVLSSANYSAGAKRYSPALYGL